MALGTSDLAVIEALIAEQTDVAVAVKVLRQRFPKISVSQCDPSDVDLETPFRTWSKFSVHLVNSAGHCWQLTSDPDRATGLVLVPA